MDAAVEEVAKSSGGLLHLQHFQVSQASRLSDSPTYTTEPGNTWNPARLAGFSLVCLSLRVPSSKICLSWSLIPSADGDYWEVEVSSPTCQTQTLQ